MRGIGRWKHSRHFGGSCLIKTVNFRHINALEHKPIVWMNKWHYHVCLFSSKWYWKAQKYGLLAVEKRGWTGNTCARQAGIPSPTVSAVLRVKWLLRPPVFTPLSTSTRPSRPPGEYVKREGSLRVEVPGLTRRDIQHVGYKCGDIMLWSGHLVGLYWSS